MNFYFFSQNLRLKIKRKELIHRLNEEKTKNRMENLKNFENESNELRLSYEKLCLDLNVDKETSLDGRNSYENLRHHY